MRQQLQSEGTADPERRSASTCTYASASDRVPKERPSELAPVVLLLVAESLATACQLTAPQKFGMRVRREMNY